MGLFDSEAGADSFYGLPAGTLEALGASESSQGNNLGTIGNIFQVTPATAANPGYGLSGVNGNDAYSVGAYLSALLHGPAQGSLPAALSLYQGQGNNPAYTGTNGAMSQFLASLNGGAPAAATGAGASTPPATATGTGSASTPSTWLSSVASFLGNYASRGALIALAILLILGAIVLFGLRTIHTETAPA